MKLKRTTKEFSKENLPLEFVRKAFSLGGLCNTPLKWEESDYTIEETWGGVKEGGSTSPWDDKDLDRGYTKQRNAVRLRPLTGFDTDIVIWNDSGRIQGYYNSGSHKANFACDQVQWVNLLLEYNFVEYDNI